MTEPLNERDRVPLIDRDALAALASEVTKQIELGNPYVTYADAMLAYLRSVLTPEALVSAVTWPSDAVHLHRRIFGENE